MIIADPPIRPKKPRISDKWKVIVDKLKNEHPGDWALIGIYSRGVATHIRKGRYPAFYPQGVDNVVEYMDSHWSIHADHLPTGNCDLYLRWDGKECFCVSCR